MPRQRVDKPKLSHSDPGAPKFFSPQAADASAPNAWDQLRDITSTRISAGPDEMIALARGQLHARRRRMRHLPQAMFGEPAWDMLLALYAEIRFTHPATVSNLGSHSGAPPTTALRWIDYLERGNWIERKPCPIDRRVVFVELTDNGRAAIEAYLKDLIAQGVVIPVEG